MCIFMEYDRNRSAFCNMNRSRVNSFGTDIEESSPFPGGPFLICIFLGNMTGIDRLFVSKIDSVPGK